MNLERLADSLARPKSSGRRGKPRALNLLMCIYVMMMNSAQSEPAATMGRRVRPVRKISMKKTRRALYQKTRGQFQRNSQARSALLMK